MKIVIRLASALKRRLFSYEKLGIFVSLPNKMAATKDFDIRYVTPSNVLDVLSFQPSRYADVFRSFLQQGSRGYYVYLADKCIHRSWVKSNEQVVYRDTFKSCGSWLSSSS